MSAGLSMRPNYKSFLKTTTHLSSGQTIDMKLNPNIFSFAIGYRF